MPIGKPLVNYNAYILDNNMNLVPFGGIGELYISGSGVARGYLNNVLLTSQKFVKTSTVEGELLYKTGDLARYLEDGNIEFLGRVDNQVKIRGNRIELGEVERNIKKLPNINNAAVNKTFFIMISNLILQKMMFGHYFIIFVLTLVFGKKI